MMMAENTTNGKLEKLLGAAADLFDFVQRLASSSNVKETGIWARR